MSEAVDCYSIVCFSGYQSETIKYPLKSVTPSIAPANRKYQSSRMLLQMPGKLHKVVDYRTDPAAANLLLKRVITFF